MRLLVVMNNYPFPPLTGSEIVAYNSLKHLSKQHVIDLICLTATTEDIVPLGFVERVELVQRNISRFKINIWFRRFFYMFLCIPSSISEHASLMMKRKVAKSIDAYEYNAILLFEMSAIQHFPPSSFRKLIVNIEDPQSIRLKRISDLSIWSAWQKVKFFLRVKLTLCYENRYLRKMAKVLLLSQADANDMQKQGSYTNIAYVPYCVGKKNIKDIKEYENREEMIIFSGNMFHPSNIDGALFLLNDIFPLIIQECPSVSLMIVGAEPDERIYEAAAIFGNKVLITGRVDDIDSYIKRAKVSVCPVRVKIGVQTKILEALSLGTPVVTTTAGNRGINGIPGTHLWVEDSPGLFAKRVCELLKGHNWKKLSIQGRELVVNKFSWEAAIEQLEKYFLDLVETRA